jgi:hypothetical protein
MYLRIYGMIIFLVNSLFQLNLTVFVYFIYLSKYAD